MLWLLLAAMRAAQRVYWWLGGCFCLLGSKELLPLVRAAGLLWVHLLPDNCSAFLRRTLQLHLDAFRDCSLRLPMRLGFHVV